MALPDPPLQLLTRNTMSISNMEELRTSPQQPSISIISSAPTPMSPTNAVHREIQAMETENIPKTNKKVRFVGVPETESSIPVCAVSKQEIDLEKLMARVERRAARRRHNRRKRIGSPPPPSQALALLFSNVNDAANDDAAKNNDDDDMKMHTKMQLLKRHLNYLEQEIQAAARMELALLNQSKAVRDQRGIMTKRFELISKKMYILQHGSGNIMSAAPVATNLPPLFNSSSANRQPRRVSATEADNKAAAACAAALNGFSECW